MPEIPAQLSSMDLNDLGDLDKALARLQALKEYQLKNQQLRKENQELKTQAAHVSASSSTGNRTAVSNIESISQARDEETLTAEEKKEITLAGKKLVVTSHIWFDNFVFYNLQLPEVVKALKGHHHYGKPDIPFRESVDDNEYLRLQITLDVYRALRPEFHSFIERKFAPLIQALKEGASACRSSLINRLRGLRPQIFKDILPARTFDAAYDRSQCAACRNLRGQTVRARESFPPILFPKGNVDFKNLFRSIVLVRILIAILHGPQRLYSLTPSSSKTVTTKKTNGDLWGIKETSSGLIAFAAVAAYFLLGPESDQFSPKSRENARNFLEDCSRYKQVIIASLEDDDAGTSVMHQTMQFFNEHVFNLRSKPKVTPVPVAVSEEEVVLRRDMLAALKGKAVSDSAEILNISPDQSDSDSWTFPMASDSPGDSIAALTGNLDDLNIRIASDDPRLSPAITNQSESHFGDPDQPAYPVVDRAHSPLPTFERSDTPLANVDPIGVDDLSDLTESDGEEPVKSTSALALARQHSATINSGHETESLGSDSDSNRSFDFDEASGTISEKLQGTNEGKQKGKRSARKDFGVDNRSPPVAGKLPPEMAFTQEPPNVPVKPRPRPRQAKASRPTQNNTVGHDPAPADISLDVQPPKPRPRARQAKRTVATADEAPPDPVQPRARPNPRVAKAIPVQANASNAGDDGFDIAKPAIRRSNRRN